LKQKGFQKYDPSDVMLIPEGTRMAYITYDNKYRSGGFLMSINFSTTNYDVENNLVDKSEFVPPDEPYIYLLYKAFNGAIFSL
jgi:hypothetical protein